MSFALDPRLAADTLLIGDLELSRALLMNDAHYPWLILVPRRAGLAEIVDLDAVDRATLIEEIAAASAFLRRCRASTSSISARSATSSGNCTSMCSAAPIGDPAWPGPVWGGGPPRAYAPDAAEAMIAQARAALGL